MSRRLTVTQWFGLIVGLLLLVAVIGLAAGLLALDRLGDRRELLVDRIDPGNTAALRLSSALLDEESGVRGYLLGADPAFLEPYRAGRTEEGAALDALRRLSSARELRRAHDDLDVVLQAAEAWRRDYAEPAISAVAEGREPPAAALGQERFGSLRAAVARLERDLREIRATARQELGDTATFVRVMFVGAGVLLVLSLVAAAMALRGVVVRPLGRLAADVREVARGEFDRPVRASGPREITVLGGDVEAMRGRIVAEVGALRDAERALLEQARELQRSNEELEQFAYVASHDLQEPLRKVASFTQMLERRYKGELDERADQYIAFAVDGARRMQELINDLLEFSRVGRMGVPHERVEASALIEEAKTRLAAALQESGAEVVADGLPAVRADAGLLTVVFQNLISNAIKFRGEDPASIIFEARREGRFWLFTCTDHGIGVDDEYAERIFVIFQRLHTRDAFKGTGIGLAMCRKIVEYHGGRIWLAPSAPDRGACFAFTLPAVDPEEDSPT